MTLEEGQDDPTPLLHMRPGASSLPLPRAPFPITSSHATTSEEGTGDVLHLETPVGTAGKQYELLTVTVSTVHAPITDGVSQDVTRIYDRN